MDQITKLVAVVLRDGIVKNHGSAFGIFTQQNIVFTFLSIIIIVGLLLYAYRRKNSEHNIYTRYGLLLIIGGGVSNIIDRVVHGYVVDFIKIPLWPTFNIADACITLGIATILWYSFFETKQIKT